jgi:pimeloyl-ACP methyl ester carboxylesterase
MWLNDSGGTVLTKSILICLAALGVVACTTGNHSGAPIPTETIAAPQPAAERTLVIVLPGIAGGAREMKERGIAQTIHAAWPNADVLLADARYPYYRDGKLVARLHEDVVTPARQAGYRRIWLAGASLGGMGAVLYEREHPGMLTGIVLFAPFLGEEALLQEIREAGGLRNWNPGPLPVQLDAAAYQRQIWARIQVWARQPELARRVWIACGTQDYLRSGAELLATALPATHFIEEPGGHTWNTWARLSRAVFSRIRTLEPTSL